jgi:hypothetical protein
MIEVERVALLALAYKQSFREQYMGREDGEYAEVTDVEGMSLLAMVGYSNFTPLDGTLLSLMSDPEPKHAVVAARVLIAQHDVWRAEALLHAWPSPDTFKEVTLIEGPLKPYLARWKAVESAMELFGPLSWDANDLEKLDEWLESAAEPRNTD